VTRSFAFEPELVAGTAVEHRAAGFERLSKRFLIHEADHEDAACDGVLNDRGEQAGEFGEIEIHVFVQ